MELTDLISIINCISTASNAKKGLASYEHQEKKLDYVLKLLNDKNLKKYNDEALNDIKQLPGQED